jgi:two-component system response regulator HydG
MTRILLVEDDVELGRLMEHVLLSARYEVDRAESVAGACSRLRDRAYDLVITDARLPDGNGMEVADRARERRAKALIVTGYGFSYPELHRYEVLLKPVRPSELVTEIHRLLGTVAAESTAEPQPTGRVGPRAQGAAVTTALNNANTPKIS